MARFKDLTGQTFGRLTAIQYVDTHKEHARWLCHCSCGGTAIVPAYALKRGNTKSCGCIHRETCTKHGMFGTPTYNSWVSMIQRCLNSNYPGFANYGGRGVSVCESWREFENFIADMGERPDGTSIDRIDVNGNYEPGNCRWATRSVQSSNQRRHQTITFNGETLTCGQWSLRLGGSANIVTKRLQAGWSEEEAVSKPLRHQKPR